jgi:hypothetical protein
VSQAVHYREVKLKRVTTTGAFTANFTIDPLEGRVTDNGLFEIELLLFTFVPGDATRSSWSIWRCIAHKEAGVLTVPAASVRGPVGAANDPLDVNGGVNYNPANRVQVGKISNTVFGVTVRPSNAPALPIGVAPNDFLEFGIWIDVKAVRD